MVTSPVNHSAGPRTGSRGDRLTSIRLPYPARGARRLACGARRREVEDRFAAHAALTHRLDRGVDLVEPAAPRDGHPQLTLLQQTDQVDQVGGDRRRDE